MIGKKTDSVEDILSVAEDSGIKPSSAREVVSFPELTALAASLVEMQGLPMRHMPVASETEKPKFGDKLLRFVGPAGRQTLLNLVRCALE